MLTASPAQRASEGEILRYLRELFAQRLGVAPTALDNEESFFSLGLTSLIHHEIMAALTASFGALSSTVLFEYPNFGLLARHLVEIESRPSGEALERAVRAVVEGS